MQVATDNLVELGLIPPMVHVLVNPSSGGEGVDWKLGEPYAACMRGIQHDTFSDRYGKHIDEVIPDAGKVVKLRRDAYSRAVAGASSGGLSAFKRAWFQPDEFSRVHSVIGSFTGIQWEVRTNLSGLMVPHLVRRQPEAQHPRLALGRGEQPRRMSRAPWIFGGGPGVIVTSLRR